MYIYPTPLTLNTTQRRTEPAPAPPKCKLETPYKQQTLGFRYKQYFLLSIDFFFYRSSTHAGEPLQAANSDSASSVALKTRRVTWWPRSSPPPASQPIIPAAAAASAAAGDGGYAGTFGSVFVASSSSS